MKLRKLWILDRKTDTLIFSQTFLVNEAISLQNTGEYSTLPLEDDYFIDAFLEKNKVENESFIRFKPVRDSCDRTDWAPVFSLKIRDKLVWPIVFITNSKHILISLPLVKLQLFTSSFVRIPEIPATVELLDVLGSFLTALANELASEQFDIENILNFVAPFGTLCNESVNNFKLALTGNFSLDSSSKEFLQSTIKQYTVTLSIKETVNGEIYNRKRIKDEFKYTGNVSVHSTLPVTTDVSANLLTTLDLTHVLPSPRLPNFSNTAGENEMKVFLMPGSDTVEVVRYRFDQVKPPIMGTYELQNVEQGFTFRVSLQFFPEQKIIFEYIEVVLPFPNRGTITSLSHEPESSREVFLNKHRNMVIWRHAKKLQADKLELSGRVKFNTKKVVLDGNPMLTGLNAYADIKFKSTNTTMSKIRLDPGSVTVFPALKFKLHYGVESSGSVLRVWNSTGDILN